MTTASASITRVVFGLCLLLTSSASDVAQAGAGARSDDIPGSPPVTLPTLPADAPCHTEASLERFLDASGYEVGYYAIQTDQGRVLERNADREVCLASMVKVFCLTELMRRQAEGLDLLMTRIDVPGHGRLSLRKAADLMIGQSDNPATYALVDYLGRERVNAIPEMLGLEGLAADILPDQETLHAALDVRIVGDREATQGLPQHGTARAMASYYQKLLAGEVISEDVSRELREFFGRHPKPFSDRYESSFIFGGKGGNILWTRPPRHFSMMGWGLVLTVPEPAAPEHAVDAFSQRQPIVLCVWGEWFPEEMTPEDQSAFLTYVTDSLIAIFEAPQRAAKRLERQSLEFQL